MSDSWLNLVGHLLIGADEYLQYLKEQEVAKKTEPVRSDQPKKTGKASDCSVGFCHWCGKPIHLALISTGDGPYWLHSETNGSQCSSFATPSG